MFVHNLENVSSPFLPPILLLSLPFYQDSTSPSLSVGLSRSGAGRMCYIQVWARIKLLININSCILKTYFSQWGLGTLLSQMEMMVPPHGAVTGLMRQHVLLFPIAPSKKQIFSHNTNYQPQHRPSTQADLEYVDMNTLRKRRDIQESL